MGDVPELPFPLARTTLLVGPSGVGKTRLTASAFEAWVEREGTDGVVVLDFAPDVERDGRILGGRLSRFTTPPGDVWVGLLDAHAPRAAGETTEEAVALARDNAERARRLFEAAPEPGAVFVNDATIPFQHDAFDVAPLERVCASADCAVLNAFESDELGSDNPVSRREREVLGELRSWADRTIALE